MLEGINRDLLPIKAHYFLFNAATGPIVPFLPTIAKQLGFSGMLLGMIYTILPLSGLVAKPLFGGLADKFKLHKTFFLTFQAILAISFYIIHFIPPIDIPADVTLSCDLTASLAVCSDKGFSSQVLKSAVYNHPYNTSCQLSCNALPENYEIICANWHSDEFCKLVGKNITTDEKFDFSVTFDMFNNLEIKNCVDIHISRIHFLDGTVETPVSVCPQHDAISTSCSAVCKENPVLNDLFEEVTTSHNSRRTLTYQFHLFLWAAVISWVGMAVVVSIADAICFNLLGTERRKEYGKQRMWGSIGFGIFGISAGYLVDVFSKGQYQKDYTCIFYIMLVCMLFDIIVSATLRKKNPDCSGDDPSVLWEILTLGKEFKVLVFGWWCIGVGMCTGVVWNFLFWYIEDVTPTSNMEWLKTLQGLLTGVQCFLGELPFNFLSGAILKKLGHINVMSLVLLVYAIRFMAYSIVSNLWVFLILEILHGPSLGLCWPTMVSYGDKVTPSGTKATMQGFIGAVFEGIGVSTGSLLCGWLMDTYGGVVTFRIFSVGALLWLTAFWLMHLLLRKVKAYPIHQGHNHLANYANPDDAILLTMSQELQTY